MLLYFLSRGVSPIFATVLFINRAFELVLNFRCVAPFSVLFAYQLLVGREM